MDFLVSRWTAGSGRRGWAVAVIAAIVGALTVASPAQAHEPYVAWTWGLNTSGQLGDGSTTGPETCETKACSATPVQVSGLVGVVALAASGSAGNGDSLALLEDGGVMAWGSNGSGQLGNGTTNDSDVPVAVKQLSDAMALAAGSQYSLALLNGGTVVAWGKGGAGQLGDGTTTNSDVPVAVCAPAPEPCPGSHLSEVVAIAAGEEQSLALLRSGKVMAWGGNSEGQLGDGTTTNRNVPVEVSGLIEVAAIAAGEEHSLALLKSGEVMAWGRNTFGQLGDHTTTNRDVPVAVCAIASTHEQCEHGSHLAGVTAVAGGGQSSLALLAGHTVLAWGINTYGQLGDGTNTGPEGCGALMTPCAATPVAVENIAHGSAIAAGGFHSLALLEGRTVNAWGRNNYGQLGFSEPGGGPGPQPCGGPPPAPCATNPVTVQHLVNVRGVAAGREHSLAFGPGLPGVTALTPSTARKSGSATKVTITGAEFEEAREVKFGSAKAASFTVGANGTTITTVAPPGKGIVDVTVNTPAGTSITSPADRFFYERPTVKRLSPRKGSGFGGTTVTITGVNFTGVTAVKFGSTEAASFKVISATSITAVSPAHVPGPVDVTVSSANGTSAASRKDRFRYT
jgi:alpha-tubulin suppressor-like RCC1 family protein